MANTERGEASITIGETRYTLKLAMNDMCALEELLSTADRPVSFLETLVNARTGSARAMRAIFWAMLQAHHGEQIQTLQQAGELLEAHGGVTTYAALLDRVLAIAEPHPEDVAAVGGGKANPLKARVGGTGARSNSRVAH